MRRFPIGFLGHLGQQAILSDFLLRLLSPGNTKTYWGRKKCKGIFESLYERVVMTRIQGEGPIFKFIYNYSII
jgi:hypothetical protein